MGLNQIKIVESEKKVHLTHYLNGKKNEPFPNEKWNIIPSLEFTGYLRARARPRISKIKFEHVLHSWQKVVRARDAIRGFSEFDHIHGDSKWVRL